MCQPSSVPSRSIVDSGFATVSKALLADKASSRRHQHVSADERTYWVHGFTHACHHTADYELGTVANLSIPMDSRMLVSLDHVYHELYQRE